MYKYILKSTGFGSERYGNCEVCGEPVDEVFLQKEHKFHKYQNGKTTWLYKTDLFGHERCLISRRRNEEKIDLELLKKLQEAGDVLLNEPTSFDKFDLPEELLTAWKNFIEAKRVLKNTAEFFDIKIS